MVHLNKEWRRSPVAEALDSSSTDLENREPKSYFTNSLREQNEAKAPINSSKGCWTDEDSLDISESVSYQADNNWALRANNMDSITANNPSKALHERNHEWIVTAATDNEINHDDNDDNHYIRYPNSYYPKKNTDDVHQDLVDDEGKLIELSSPFPCLSTSRTTEARITGSPQSHGLRDGEGRDRPIGFGSEFRLGVSSWSHSSASATRGAMSEEDPDTVVPKVPLLSLGSAAYVSAGSSNNRFHSYEGGLLSDDDMSSSPSSSTPHIKQSRNENNAIGSGGVSRGRSRDHNTDFISDNMKNDGSSDDATGMKAAPESIMYIETLTHERDYLKEQVKALLNDYQMSQEECSKLEALVESLREKNRDYMTQIMTIRDNEEKIKSLKEDLEIRNEEISAELERERLELRMTIEALTEKEELMNEKQDRIVMLSENIATKVEDIDNLKESSLDQMRLLKQQEEAKSEKLLEKISLLENELQKYRSRTFQDQSRLELALADSKLKEKELQDTITMMEKELGKTQEYLRQNGTGAAQANLIHEAEMNDLQAKLLKQQRIHEEKYDELRQRARRDKEELRRSLQEDLEGKVKVVKNKYERKLKKYEQDKVRNNNGRGEVKHVIDISGFQEANLRKSPIKPILSPDPMDEYAPIMPEVDSLTPDTKNALMSSHMNLNVGMTQNRSLIESNMGGNSGILDRRDINSAQGLNSARNVEGNCAGTYAPPLNYSNFIGHPNPNLAGYPANVTPNGAANQGLIQPAIGGVVGVLPQRTIADYYPSQWPIYQHHSSVPMTVQFNQSGQPVPVNISATTPNAMSYSPRRWQVVNNQGSGHGSLSARTASLTPPRGYH